MTFKQSALVKRTQCLVLSSRESLAKYSSLNLYQNMSKPNFELEEPSGQYVVLSYPAPGVLLVRLNRPKDLNCINQDGHIELDRIWKWLDAEPTLNVGVITGTGRAFCAGADLKGKQ
jgi:1,4-dihydroxy-2-naphthoyl-CoA synthase